MEEFRLSEKDIILRLLNEVSKASVTLPASINVELPFLDIYGDQDPGVIFKDYDDHKEIYFLTELKPQQHPQGSYVRKSGKRSWQYKDDESDIKDLYGKKIGTRKGFFYMEIHSNSSTGSYGTDYLMREYSVGDKFKRCIRQDRRDYVLCTVQKKDGYDVAHFAKPLQEAIVDVERYLDLILEANPLESAPLLYSPVKAILACLNRDSNLNDDK
ncbi:uncharacterized protein LOC127252959 [Andrographis paniculata]|uniref:uncharacterized protein LOC127252959 n=1 Tax=Andrographis paniculata TaxID=175694 RepID=UPI0021E8BA56|nr:uncharacterized protein LOC127252959 [Andrographis paniculata]